MGQLWDRETFVSGKRAKKIRRMVYGPYSPRPEARLYNTPDGKTIQADARRRAYQEAKKGAR